MAITKQDMKQALKYLAVAATVGGAAFVAGKRDYDERGLNGVKSDLSELFHNMANTVPKPEEIENTPAPTAPEAPPTPSEQ